MRIVKEGGYIASAFLMNIRFKEVDLQKSA